LRIVRTSDWHLGQNFMGKSIIEEHEAFLSWLLEIIKEKQVEVLIISGDIFDYNVWLTKEQLCKKQYIQIIMI
jgi:DNA repair protein SbcD/Mre11